MIKTFITGIVLGVAGAIAALYFVPVVDQQREVSLISVNPNGGNFETFHINIPMDRILVGDSSSDRVLPPGLEWPDTALFEGARAELFKLRNSRNAIVGVASRVAADKDEIGDLIEWVLHLPARGSLFIRLEPGTSGGERRGSLSAGTREFESIVGALRERWVADTSGEIDAPAGRIELVASFVSSAPVDVAEGAP